MKKIFYTVLFLMAATFVTGEASAQVRYQPAGSYRQVASECFFYYPASNVYYSFRTRQYIYPVRNGWQIAYRVPHYIHIGLEARVKIEHRGFDVWTDNLRHQYAYGRRYRNEPLIVYAPEKRYNGF